MADGGVAVHADPRAGGLKPAGQAGPPADLGDRTMSQARIDGLRSIELGVHDLQKIGRVLPQGLGAGGCRRRGRHASTCAAPAATITW